MEFYVLPKKKIKKSLNSFLVYLEWFSQSAGITTGGERRDMGMRKRTRSNLFYFLMSLTLSFGGRMRFGKLVGEIQSIRESLNKAGFMAFTGFLWEQS